MIIGLCGFGYTGSGAVFDLLKEYNGLTVANQCEMSFLYRPDGLTDLQYHLYHPARFFSSDYAIKRFREKIHKFFRNHPETWGLKNYDEIYKTTDEYLDSITSVKWRGWWSDDTDYMNSFEYIKYRILNKIFSISPRLNISMQKAFYYRDMCLSVYPEDFILKTQQYISDIYHILGYDIDNDTIILDQTFSADHPSASSLFYKKSKAIVIDKDPRDLYLILKREHFKDCAWTPTGNVDDFIKYYHLLRRNYSEIDRDKELLIKFEDLVYEYDSTVSRIENYIGLDSKQHVKPYTYFNPQKSINNTQLFRKYPDLKLDIEVIERELEQYLFDFDKYPALTSFGNTF